MTRAEIIAELRRSACEDAIPWQSCEREAWLTVYKFISNRESLLYMPACSQSLFFLLAAHAVEDEG